MSPQQQRAWSLCDPSGDSAALRALSVVRVEGALDPETLRLAWRRTVERYEILRTTFRIPAGMRGPLQVIGAPGDRGLEPTLRIVAAASEEQVIGRHLDPQRRQPFDLENGPLLEATLAVLSPQRALLLLDLSALCVDVAGLEQLVRVIAEVYGGAIPEEGTEPMQYADFSEWQSELLESPDTREGLEYWQKRAGGEERGTGYSTVTAEGFAPRSLEAAHSLAQSARLIRLAGECKTSPAILLLASYQALWARLDDEPAAARRLLGLVSCNRKYAELERVIGLLARLLPVPLQHRQDASIRQLAGEQEETVQQGREWEEYCPNPPEGAYFSRCFEYEENPVPWTAGGVRWTIVHRRVCFDRFDLKLVCVRRGEALVSEWHYDSGRYERSGVERLAERWRTLLEDALAHPERPFRDLELLGEAEWRQLAAWNGPRVEYERERLLPGRIAQRAAEHPDLPAIECQGRQLTYRELNARANRVAHRLLSLGVGVESRVAVSAPRSLDLVVGVLGILKSGAAYVPLDPGYPAARLAFMLEDSGTDLVLSMRDAEAGLAPATARTEWLWLDEGEEWARSSTAEPEVRLEPAQTAYLIYTSGSTGQPKGVAVSHANLLHSTAARWQHYGDQVEGFMMVSSFSFDSSVAGLFWTLSRGGMVYLPAEGGQRDALGLAQRLGAGGITHLLCLPSFYAALLESAASLGSLRVAIVAGESCPPELPGRHRERLPEVRFYNEYGPTEATVWTSVWEAPADDLRLSSVPIGRVIANAEVWLMDGAGRPVPVGVVGEIHIGGDGVARGYARRPSLTAERFAPDGLSGKRGARLYRTGDLGRWTDAGEIAFLGRADKQVKLRGYRIELGEIEAALRSHPSVAEAAVVLRDGGAQGPRLVGYWRRRGEPATGVSEPGLREWLRQKLPEPMIPAALAELAEWPRTSNGKLDEQALPSPEAAGAGSAVDPARNAIEEVVAAVWADVLGSAREPGRKDNFFDLGGHSLLATQAVSRLRGAFCVDLTLPMLFEAPTVAQMAARIEQMQPGSAIAAPPLVPGRRPQQVPLSFSQRRLWFLDKLYPGNPFYNINTAVRLRGLLWVPALTRTLATIKARHEILRTRFPELDGEPLQEIVAPGEAGEVAIERLDLASWPAEDREAEARRRIEHAAGQPFDLARGPLLRALLITLAPNENLLLLILHHIVADGWSLGLLVRELSTLYTAFREGLPSPLPPLSIQYADYACWQHQWLQGEVLEEQLGYWRERLAGAPVALDLPLDYPRPPVPSFRGATHPFNFAEDLARRLRSLSRSQDVTLFMTLLAAFALLLRRVTGAEDIVVGINVAGRNRQETEGMVGFFINQLALRCDLGGDPSFRELLEQVRQTTLQAYAHQDLPFEMLAAELRPERSAARAPFVQVKIDVTRPFGSFGELAGLAIDEPEAINTALHCELQLGIEETDNGLQAAIAYDRDLFAASTISRLENGYRSVLEACVETPELRVSEILDLLATDERRLESERKHSFKGAFQARLRATREREV